MAAIPAASPSSDIHALKEIQFEGRKTRIVTQNKNGPCPLLAIINVLLLRGQVHIDSDYAYLPSGQLVSLVGNTLLSKTPSNGSEEYRLNYQQNLSDAMGVVPKLQTGLDVNVGFTSPTDFEYTSDCLVFDLLNIRLLHGWLADPSQPEIYEALQHLKYNQLVEKIIESKSLDSTEKPEAVNQGILLEQFLYETASQLTYQGIAELNSTLKDGEIAVFFRNNHFSTIYKRKGEIFLLLTDQGFTKVPVVWETLANVEGDGVFVNSEFVTFSGQENVFPDSVNHPFTGQIENHGNFIENIPIEQQIPQLEPNHLTEEALSADFMLALQLQEDENQRAAAANMARQPQPQPQSQPDNNRRSGDNSRLPPATSFAYGQGYEQNSESRGKPDQRRPSQQQGQGQGQLQRQGQTSTENNCEIM